VLAEFAEDLPVLMVSVGAGRSVVKRKKATLGALLPHAFRLRT
jgi:hypothetical protein